MRLYQAYTGNPFFLKLSLNHLLNYYSKKDIYLIGDESNSKLGAWNHYIAKKNTEFNQRLKKNYVHLSTNSEKFEYQCLERWIDIYEHVNITKYSGPIVHTDSDTYLNCRIDGLTLQKYDLANVGLTGPQFLYFKNKSVLKRFIEFFLEFYEDSNKTTTIKDFFKSKVSDLPWHGGNVCDMHFLGLFSLSLKERYSDFNSIFTNGYFEVHIGELEGFKRNPYFGIKQVFKSISGVPFGFKNGVKVALLGQHFVGNLKVFMWDFCTKSERKVINLNNKIKIFKTKTKYFFEYQIEKIKNRIKKQVPKIKRLKIFF